MAVKMDRKITVSLGTAEAEERKAALERLAERVEAIGYHGTPAISTLMQMIADGDLEVTMRHDYVDETIREIPEATADQVAITRIETRPEYDAYVNLPGRPTYTALFIDPARRVATVTQQQRTNSTTMSIYHGVHLETTIYGHPDEGELRDYLEQGAGQELLQDIVYGHTVDWDGQNHVGSLSEDAAAAWDELKRDMNNYHDSKYSFWEAGEWLLEGARSVVTAQTTDEELAEWADAWMSHAQAENVVLDEAALDWLTNYRDQLREEEE